jgi:CBS domain-containing protein
MRVVELMQRQVVSVGPDASLSLAAQLMRDQDVGCLPVIQGDELVGMLTDRDIVVRCVAAGCDPTREVVRQAMSAPAFACSPEDSVEEAREAMSGRGIKHLPVTSGRGRVIGLLALRDIDIRFGRARPHQVTFYKRLADSSGHLFKVEVARLFLSPAIATEEVVPAALARFASERGLRSWDERADLYELDEGG